MKLTKLATIGTLAISIAGLSACNSMMADESAAAQSAPVAQAAPASQQAAASQPVAEMNVVQIAQSDANFSLLVEAVQAADIAGALSDPNASFTVFAPTNDAFAQALQETGLTKEQLFADKALLTKILGYHVISGEAPIYASDVAPGDIVMLSQDTLTVTPEGNLMDENGRTINLVQTDVPATNGVIHVIDNVLLPK